MFLSFQAKIKRAVFFYLLVNPAETAYLSVRDVGFQTSDGLLNSGTEKLQFTPFGVVPSRAAQTAFVLELSKAVTFLSYVLSW